MGELHRRYCGQFIHKSSMLDSSPFNLHNQAKNRRLPAIANQFRSPSHGRDHGASTHASWHDGREVADDELTDGIKEECLLRRRLWLLTLGLQALGEDGFVREVLCWGLCRGYW
jgi:hypothetical protein